MGKATRLRRLRANGTSSLSRYVQDAINVLLLLKPRIQEMHPQPRESHRGGTTCMMRLPDGKKVSFAVLAQHTGLDPDQVAWASCLYKAYNAAGLAGPGVQQRDLDALSDDVVQQILWAIDDHYDDYRQWVDERLAEDLADFLSRHPNVGSVTTFGPNGISTMTRPAGGWPSL